MTRSQEVEQKLERLRGWLAESGRAGLLIRRRANFAWLTAGGRSHVSTANDAGAAALLVTADRMVVVASNLEARRLAEEELAGVPVEVVDFPWQEPDGERRALEAAAGDPSKLAADTDPTLAAPLAALRARLLPPEIERYQELGRLASAEVERLCCEIDPGETEDDVAALVQVAGARHGARVPVCLVAADGRIATRRHPLPTGATIRQRVMVATCWERGGLVCSITRLVSFAPLDEDLRRRHDAVVRVDAAAAAATRVGRPLRDVFADIVRAYAETGYAEEWRYHHQGGSTGYQPRDTIANPTAGAEVQPNQPFAWNPSIAGTKSEDTLLATPAGPRWITAPGPEWPACELETGGIAFRRADILVR